MITRGEIIKLEGNKEYICIDNIIEENYNILYFVSNFKPLEVVIARQKINSPDYTIELINEIEQKRKLFKLFKEENGKNR